MYRRIRRSELNDLAGEWHFSLDEGEIDEFHTLTEFIHDVTDGVEGLPQPAPDVLPAKRDPGREPGDDEDPYNAVVRWCSVKQEGAEGVLSGTRIGIKDSIALAGVPMTGGSNLLRDFTPNFDSAVAERILREGGEIVAVLNMDYLAFSGGGDSSAYGPTLCPFDTERTAGGSSGGSGAALYYDGIDIAVGCDQGGSIRVPAAWCGAVGLKPTYGLVPYVGIIGIDHPIDYAGPMARSAADAARLLQAIAGKHELDPRQPPEVPVGHYVKAVEQAPDDLKGLKLAVLAEAVGADLIEPESLDGFRETTERFAELGAEITEVSVPEHLRGGGVAFTGFMEGMTALVTSGGNGFHWKGRYWPELARALAAGLRAHGDELSNQVKLTLMVGTHMRKFYLGEVYARAHNLHNWLRAGYERGLDGVDMLIMPTSTNRPHTVAPGELGIAERVQRGWGILGNTAPMNITGHPAISLPTAEREGLPIGTMLMARHFEDDRLLSLARTYEQRFGWVPEHPGDPRPADARPGT